MNKEIKNSILEEINEFLFKPFPDNMIFLDELTDKLIDDDRKLILFQIIIDREREIIDHASVRRENIPQLLDIGRNSLTLYKELNSIAKNMLDLLDTLPKSFKSGLLKKITHRNPDRLSRDNMKMYLKNFIAVTFTLIHSMETIIRTIKGFRLIELTQADDLPRELRVDPSMLGTTEAIPMVYVNAFPTVGEETLVDRDPSNEIVNADVVIAPPVDIIEATSERSRKWFPLGWGRKRSRRNKKTKHLRKKTRRRSKH
jgi:hypothetical protein